MDRLDQDLSTMILRANAWANGDIAQLKELPFVDHKQACSRALASNEVARQQGILDLDQRIKTQWLAVARKALAEKDTVFATLPIGKLLEADGVLAALSAEGYTVTSPE